MKLAKRENNEIIVGETIEHIHGLINSQLIVLERGDKMKKAAKGFNSCFGRKDLTSVKALEEALKINSWKAAKKAKSGDDYELCCVCTDFYPTSTLDSKGICRSCQIC